MQTKSADVKGWHIVVAAAAVIIAVAVGAMVLIVQSKPHGVSGNRAHGDWQPPAQTFLESSMRVQPVPGWRTRLVDLGLPDGSRIATNDSSRWSEPLVGVLGDRGFYLANSPVASGKQWWLVGVDARTGGKSFGPIRLDIEEYPPQCFLNGPEVVLCLRDDAQDGVLIGSTAWVIDARSGAVTFTGPSDVHAASGDLSVSQVGIYAVAHTRGQGIYGVGPKAGTTWFVPGEGSVRSGSDDTATSPPGLATQEVAENQTVVFSVIDGKVISPDLSEGSRPSSAVVYPGGFAVAVSVGQRGASREGVDFFDDSGKRLGHADVSGHLSTSPDLPVAESTPQSIVFGPRGQELTQVSGFDSGAPALLIGNRLIVADRSGLNTVWRQYDLNTGVEGHPCTGYRGGFIGSSGTTGIFEDHLGGGLKTKAFDLETCDALWTLTSPEGSFRDVWRLDTTLVQLSDDGTELMSLMPPAS